MKQATPLFLYLVEQSLKVTVFIPFQSVTTPKPQLSQLPIRQKKENVTIIKKEIKVKTSKVPVARETCVRMLRLVIVRLID